MTGDSLDAELTDLLSRLDRSRIPAHVGVIMDGNGRWATQRGYPRAEGHREGIERVRELIPFAANTVGVGALTLYVFSIENWQRPADEVEGLMVLLEYFLTEEIALLIRENVRFRACGNVSSLPPHIRTLIEEGEKKTAGSTGMILIAALSYGGRDEIVRAVRSLMAKGLPPEVIDEEKISGALDTAGLPDPDLIIRTSGERRLSNFLLWQSAYSELYFTDILWPEFDKPAFVHAILDYQGRERRYGGLPAGK